MRCHRAIASGRRRDPLIPFPGSGVGPYPAPDMKRPAGLTPDRPRTDPRATRVSVAELEPRLDVGPAAERLDLTADQSLRPHVVTLVGRLEVGREPGVLLVDHADHGR